uniref:Uncharacterized protein n=1 Tax=Cannabis sativa TaxID=3483 RepID=A0A803PCC9_CANSA
MEVCVNDMLVKSKRSEDHIKDLEECFNILLEYRMKLDPLNCGFNVQSRNFIRFIVNSRGIPPIKKLAYNLVLASRKLRPYFQAHTVKVRTDQPLRQVLMQLGASRCLLKCAVKLGQFEITYQPQKVIKRLALAYFIVECNGLDEDNSMICEDQVHTPKATTQEDTRPS